MKKALVLAIALVIGLGALAFAGPLSGSWESELTIGFRDVTLTETSFTFTHLGGTYDVTAGTVAIPAHIVTMTYSGGTYDVTIPAIVVPVGPYSVTLSAVAIYQDCLDNTIDVCEGSGVFNTIPFTVPGEEDIPVDFGTVSVTYGGTYLFTNDTTGQTASVTLADTTWIEPRSVLCCCGADEINFVFPELNPVIPASIVSVGDNPTFVIAAETAVYDACASWTTAPQVTRTATCPGCNGYTVVLTAAHNEAVTENTFTRSAFLLTGSTICGNGCTVPIPACTYDLAVLGCEGPLPEREFSTDIGGVFVPAHTGTVVIDGETMTYTIPADTYTVSDQTVTIPPFTETVPGWTTTIENIPTLGFTSTLIVDYTVGGWVFNSTSDFDDTGWIAQSFAATGVLGAFSLTSDLVFAPATAAFTSWDSTGSVSIAGVAFDGEFYLTGLGSGWTFGASGGAGDVSLGATVYFNMDSDGDLIADEYCFCFSSVDFDVSFPFACIDLVDISLGFSTTGFDGVTFSVTGIAIPNISWLTFDVDLAFATGVSGKTMTITPNLNFGTFTCITIYGELLGTFPQITGYNIYGIGLTYTWNGVTFSSLSALAPGWYVTSDVALDDEGSYWEAFTISSEADACCGGLFDFSVSTFFDKNSAMLFDWGESSVELSMGLGSNYTGWTGLVVKDTGFDSWTIGFKVTW